MEIKELIEENTELKKLILFLENKTDQWNLLCTCNQPIDHKDHCIVNLITSKVKELLY